MAACMPNIKFPLFLFFIVLPLWLEGQHPSWHNYTINDGLPANEVYAMKQDSRGYIWFGTDLGICRFNGYEFIRPADSSTAATGAVFHIEEDSRGRIWFNHLDGTLWIVENDTIRPWTLNHLILDFAKQYRPTLRFAVARDGSVWIPTSNAGFQVIHPDGTLRTMPGLSRSAHCMAMVDGRSVCAYQSAGHTATAESRINYRSGQTREVLLWQDGTTVSLGWLPARFSGDDSWATFEMWRLKNGDLVGTFSQDYYLIRNQRMIWHGRKNAITRVIWEDPDGGLLACVPFGNNRGLLRFRSTDHFRRDEFDNLLPGHTVVAVLRDYEGGWWAATADAGVFYCKNPEVDIFDLDSGMPSADVLNLATDGKSTVYAGLRSLDLAVFQRRPGRPLLAPRPPIFEWVTLRYDTLTGRLWAGNNLCYLDKNRWKPAPWVEEKTRRHIPIAVKNLSPDPAGRRWWAASHAGFYSVDRFSGLAARAPRQADAMLRTFSVDADPEGGIWVATIAGLKTWGPTGYQDLSFTHPALRFQPRKVDFLPAAIGGGMVISLRGAGLLFRYADGRFNHLTTRNELSTDWISRVVVSPDGMLYACSHAGLSILSPQPGGNWRIETLTTKHGLPSNLVNDVVLLDGEIWVATDQGIARFREKPAEAPMPVPVLEKFTVNNRPYGFSENLSLPHQQNNITLRFFALHFRSDGDIPYRYRLLGTDTAFVYTRTREVNFANLPPGRYDFEVQARNENGQWSPPARWMFSIRPPWWATWWFRVLLAAMAAAAAFLFYRGRLRAIRRENREREKIRDLETAALRAQMNPHFIFSCLQAIQSFIAQNDRHAAATYLARFARLVRQALHGSVDGRHTLGEEIAMLENYLHLEQLRFPGKFGFTIRTEAGIDPEAIRLPPLLVQPFVENALIHGLQERENGGRVEVLFARKGQALEVSVTDNGQGFSDESASGNGRPHPHRSVGMMLTQKRLELLAGQGDATNGFFTRETIFDDAGKAAGARVRLVVPVLEGE